MFDVVASQLTGAFLPDWEQRMARLALEAAALRLRSEGAPAQGGVRLSLPFSRIRLR